MADVRTVGSVEFESAVEEEDEELVSQRSPFTLLQSCEEPPSSSPAGMSLAAASASGGEIQGRGRLQLPIVAILVAALRKSVVICSVEPEEACALDIGRPTDVRHVSHVTFDRFNGFLGLPVEFEPEVPWRVPSASASVFGVSAESMQCSYDARGNSVPTILLMMQRRLYSQGGLQAEGIFRINAENGQEEHVRDQLNRGIVPYNVDVHCLAGLIKAWFRELPTGVLDTLSPDQVMHCNTEADCSRLVQLLPPTEAALLDWAINLMADVVENEHHNKMNARNIAMVFAPNMTQMADPLTALIHAVQVMNFLKTLILKIIQEREESAAKERESSFHPESPSGTDRCGSSRSMTVTGGASTDCRFHDESVLDMFLRSTDCGCSSDADDSFGSFPEKYDADDESGLMSTEGSPRRSQVSAIDGGRTGRFSNGDVESLLDRLNLRKGVRKICMRPAFNMSKAEKKSSAFGIVDSTKVGREEAWWA
ncbi:Rho GTPase-activating protein 3 [Nymphaea thermarum]|nr:Rho GTPase-activating protein 3 [Nymphaea thermarum]